MRNATFSVEYDWKSNEELKLTISNIQESQSFISISMNMEKLL